MQTLRLNSRSKQRSRRPRPKKKRPPPQLRRSPRAKRSPLQRGTSANLPRALTHASLRKKPKPVLLLLLRRQLLQRKLPATIPCQGRAKRRGKPRASRRSSAGRKGPLRRARALRRPTVTSRKLPPGRGTPPLPHLSLPQLLLQLLEEDLWSCP